MDEEKHQLTDPRARWPALALEAMVLAPEAMALAPEAMALAARWRQGRCLVSGAVAAAPGAMPLAPEATALTPETGALAAADTREELEMATPLFLFVGFQRRTSGGRKGEDLEFSSWASNDARTYVDKAITLFFPQGLPTASGEVFGGCFGIVPGNVFHVRGARGDIFDVKACVDLQVFKDLNARRPPQRRCRWSPRPWR